jgi:hypothetical protein
MRWQLHTASVLFDALGSKHPRSESLPQHSDNPTVRCLELQEPDIIVAIKLFPAGSAAGFDGLRAQHVKDIISAQTG